MKLYKEKSVIVYLSGGHTNANEEQEFDFIKRAHVKYRCYAFGYTCPKAFYYNKGLHRSLDHSLKAGVKVFMDSSAYSFQKFSHSANVKRKRGYTEEDLLKLRDDTIDLYVQYCKEHGKDWDFYANFDYVRHAPIVYKVQKQLEKRGIRPVPVYHGDDGVSWLKRYCEEGHKLICVGGTAVGNRTTWHKNRAYLDTVFNITEKYGVKVHGLAITSFTHLFQFPMYSADSVANNTMILIRQAGRIRVDSIEEIFWSACGPVEFSELGHAMRRLYDVETLVPDVDGKAKWCSVDYVVRHETNKALYRVQSRRGRLLETTDDHCLIVNTSFKKRQLRTCSAKELVPGVLAGRLVGFVPKSSFLEERRTDIILEIAQKAYRSRGSIREASVTTRSLPYRVILDEDFLAFLGLWVADGSYTKRGIGGTQVSAANDMECRRLLKKIAKRYSALFSVRDNGVDCTLGASIVAKIIQALGFGRGSRCKEIPWWLFDLSQMQIAAFLRGYFSGDGSAGKNYVGCGTTSAKLFYGVYYLLCSLGIRCTLRPAVKETETSIGSYSNPALPRTGGAIVIKDLAALRIFRNKIGFLQRRKNKTLAEAIFRIHSSHGSCGARDITYNDEEYLPVLHVRKLTRTEEIAAKLRGERKRYVYDLSVSDGQKFVANGLLVHNSASWIKMSAFGKIAYVDPVANVIGQVHISDQSSKHRPSYNAMTKLGRKQIEQQVESYGFDFQKVRTSLLERGIYNAYMFSTVIHQYKDMIKAGRVEWESIL